MRRHDSGVPTLGLLTALALVAGCGGHQYLEVGVYENFDVYTGEHAWEDGGSPVAVFKVRNEMEVKGQRVVCEYLHISNWFTGRPFNDEPESVLDAVGCAFSIDLGGM